MINFKSLFSASAAVILATAILSTSCEDEQFDGWVKGAAMAKSETTATTIVSNVQNGDKLILVIGTLTELDGKKHELSIRPVTISGIQYIPNVHYYIDGVEVGKSNDISDTNNCFKCEYRVANLAPGLHTLTAEVPKQYENISYTFDIHHTTFNVVERR